jgi:hypothetical protein
MGPETHLGVRTAARKRSKKMSRTSDGGESVRIMSRKGSVNRIVRRKKRERKPEKKQKQERKWKQEEERKQN